MKYVLDSSAGLKWVLPEVESYKAIRLRDEYRNGIHALLTPDIFRSEIANGLVAAERQARIKPGESAILLHDILSTAPVLHSSSSFLIRAMEMALGTKQAVYDCLYLALAEQEPCELMTADTLFAKNVRPRFPFVITLASLP